MVNTGKTTGKRVILFGNPRAGAASRQREIEAFADLLRARQYHIEIITDPAVLSETASHVHESGELRMVVAAGGDGTVRLVVNRISSDVPVMAVPMGTENLLAKYLQISHNLQQWCDMVDAGTWLKWDTGQVVAAGESHTFLLMLSCGFDADVVRRLHERRSGNIRHFSYAKPIFDSIRKYGYPELRIQYRIDDGDEWTDHRAHWAFVFNIPAYAGGLRITPAADPGDGLLDLCTFVGGSFPRGLLHLGTVMLRQQGEWSNFAHVHARQIRISSEQDVPYQIDGDPGGISPVEIETVSGCVTMVVPPNWQPQVPLA